ncbi:MAG: adenine phosphoribosyltransferase [SAR324 cluster bacterium]|nr:adenine phosphoribosyltransferase [SAR324 cluster bacterium]
MEHLKAKVRTILDFPKPGIQFRDITTLLSDPEGFQEMTHVLANRYKDYDIDAIVGVEARGFIIGSVLALVLKKGFIPVRKPGKLPGETIGIEYELEYGTDRLEMHIDALPKGSRVLIVDDLLATGGTMQAACHLVEKAGSRVVECTFVIDLPDLGGREKLLDYPIYTMMSFEGE